MISENQGLEKLRYILDLRKISGPAELNFFSVCRLNFFQIYTINLKKIQVTNGKKKSKCAGPEMFQQTLISQDLDFQKSRCRLNGRLLRLQKNWVILTQEYYGTGKFQHWDILAPWTFQQVSCQHVRCRNDPKKAKYHMPQSV